MGEEMKKYAFVNLIYNTIVNFLGVDFDMNLFADIISLFVYLNALELILNSLASILDIKSLFKKNSENIKID